LVIDNNSARSFNINTDLLTSGLGTRTLNLQGAGAGLSTFAGKIETGTLTTLGITKSEAGTWVLSGANTYNGKTTVSAGTLSVNSIQNDESTTANALGTPGVGTNSIIDIATTGILRYTGTGHSSDRVINMTGNGGTYTVDASGTGTGLALTGGMTAGGTSGTSTLALTGTGLGSQSGAISNGTSTNVAAVTKSGTGTWTLGATNTYTGSTTLNAGTLKLNYDTGSGGTTGSKLSDTASIGTLLLNGGTLELSGGSSLTETVLSTTLNTGGTFIKQTGGDTKLSMGAITFTAGAIDFSAGSIATTTTGTASTLLNQRATVAGTNFAMKDAGNTNIVAYDYVTSGSTGYTGAAMTANINYALTSNAANTLAGTTGATSNTLKIANTATASLAVAGNTLTLGAILFAGSANYDITTSGAGKITPSILHNYGTGGAVLNLGALGGALTQFGTGKTILTSAALANAGVTVNGGTVQFSTNAQLGTPSNGAALTLNNGTLLASETVTLDNGGLNIRGVTLNAGGGTLAAASTKTLTVSGVISGALNPLTIGSVGNTGTVTLSGTNTYTGATNINNGILAVSNAGSINSTSAINVAAGAKFVYNSSTSLTKAPILAGDGISNRAVLGGAGSIGVAVTLDNLGDVLSPGNSPGIQTYTTAQSWSSFTYDWEVNDFTGPDAGTAFDQLRLTTLDLTGGSGSYVLNVLGLTAGNTTGLVPNFSEISRSWTILTTSAGISNFNTASWSINTTGFSDPDTGNWSLAQSGNDLVLSYTVIPEPKAALLGGLGIIFLLRRRR
jgi:autotransporter-associated beta strand protein